MCVGAIGLGVVDATEDPELRAARQAEGNRKYAKSFLALALPVAYCLLDAAGTFADNRVLETLDEGSANVAYELTFLVAAVVLLRLRRAHPARTALIPKTEAPKYLGAICETAGQFAYIYAIADTEHLAMSAPIITLLLRGERAVEPPVPQGKALVEALRDDRSGGRRHRHHGRVRRLKETRKGRP